MQNMTYGPKITNGGDPGRKPRIDITACNCGGFEEIKGLNGLIGKVCCVLIMDVKRWSARGKRTRSSLKAVSIAMCCLRTGIRFSLNRTRYFALAESKTSMETKADFITTNDMDVALEPLVGILVLLYKDEITLGYSE